VAGAVIGFALVAWLVSRFDSAAVGRAFIEMDKRALLGAVLLAGLSMVVRAWRWRRLVGSASGSFGAYFAGLMTGYLANNLLPARGGGLVRVLWLGASAGISRSLLLGTVVVERVVDLLSTVLVLGIALALAPLPPWLQRGGLNLGALALAAVLGLWAYGHWGERLHRLAQPLLRRLPQVAAQPIEIALQGSLIGMRSLWAVHTAALYVLATLVLWGIELLIVWLFAWAFGIPLGLPEAVIVAVFTAFSAMIPSLPGQIGVFEAAVVAGMHWLGHTGESVMAFALGWHLTLLLTTSGLGALCLLQAGRVGLAPVKLLHLARTVTAVDDPPGA
jgi:hypothetical protein